MPANQNDLAYRFKVPCNVTAYHPAHASDCPDCRGDGFTRPLLVTCARCGGDGKAWYGKTAGGRIGGRTVTEECRRCHSIGVIPLPPAERTVALLEALDNRLVCFGGKLPNGYVQCYIHPRPNETWTRIEGDGKTRSTALFAAAMQLKEAQG